MAKNIKPKHKILFVTWNDAESIDAWTSELEVEHETAAIHSVGWLLKQDNESITLALNHDTKNESYSCIMKIPKGMIVSKKFLRS